MAESGPACAEGSDAKALSTNTTRTITARMIHPGFVEGPIVKRMLRRNSTRPNFEYQLNANFDVRAFVYRQLVARPPWRGRPCPRSLCVAQQANRGFRVCPRGQERPRRLRFTANRRTCAHGGVASCRSASRSRSAEPKRLGRARIQERSHPLAPALHVHAGSCTTRGGRAGE